MTRVTRFLFVDNYVEDNHKWNWRPVPSAFPNFETMQIRFDVCREKPAFEVQGKSEGGETYFSRAVVLCGYPDSSKGEIDTLGNNMRLRAELELCVIPVGKGRHLVSVYHPRYYDYVGAFEIWEGKESKDVKGKIRKEITVRAATHPLAKLWRN